MKLAELRQRLLSQHAELRKLVIGLIECAGRVRADQGALGELRIGLIELDQEVCAHNEIEERELHSILPTIDAWGPRRHELMTDRHRQEHATILAAIRGAGGRSGGADAIADATVAALKELVTHMDREERELLNADVLRDDIITSGVGG